MAETVSFVRATVKTWNGALSSERREAAPGSSRVRENTSKGPAKSSTSTPSKIRMPTFHLSMAVSFAALTLAQAPPSVKARREARSSRDGPRAAG